MSVQRRHDAGAALRFLRRPLKNRHVEPETIVTHGLRSFRAALERSGLVDRYRPGRLRQNKRAGKLIRAASLILYAPLESVWGRALA